MPTTTNLGMVLPDVGGSASVWGSLINDALTNKVDLHDHSSGKGVQVPSSGLKINADVSWSFAGTNYSITDAKAIEFTPVAAASVSSYAGALWCSSSDDNLYWRTIDGSNVQLTAGAALNIAGFVGGIGGDYTSVSALLDYDDATDMYRLRQEEDGGVRQYAKLGCADIELREYDAAGDATVPTNAITIKSPDALAAGYSITLPAAVPAARVPLYMNASGELSTTGDVIFNVSPANGDGSGWAWDAANGYLLSSGAGTWSVGIPAIVGMRLKSVTFERYGDASADLTGDVLKRAKAAAVSPSLRSISVTNAAASYVDETCDIADVAVVDGDSFWITFTASAANLRIGEIRITYDYQ